MVQPVESTSRGRSRIAHGTGTSAPHVLEVMTVGEMGGSIGNRVRRVGRTTGIAMLERMTVVRAGGIAGRR